MMAVTLPAGAIDPQNDELNDAEKNISADSARHARGNNDPREDNRGKQQRHGQQPRRDKRDVHGWVILDKPIGMTSTHAVAVVKRLFSAKRAGHAGTLDPLASGGLPIALGEATKTVPFVMDGRKRYRFTVAWGEERDTDDTEGRVTQTSDVKPTAEAIRALLPQFTGLIEQTPPQYSAIKIAGERAYDLARDGETVPLQPRPVEIHQLTLVEQTDSNHSVFEAECGKGTYVRALARDMGRILGCYGHICALRRTLVGPFGEDDMIPLEQLEALARAASPTRFCPLRPRWTTSRRWPSHGLMRQGSIGARPFCCADGMRPIVAAQSMSRWQAVFWRLLKLAMANSSPGACST
jgi:tRNA pseudouridine55 synthase